MDKSEPTTTGAVTPDTPGHIHWPTLLARIAALEERVKALEAPAHG